MIRAAKAGWVQSFRRGVAGGLCRLRGGPDAGDGDRERMQLRFAREVHEPVSSSLLHSNLILLRSVACPV